MKKLTARILLGLILTSLTTSLLSLDHEEFILFIVPFVKSVVFVGVFLYLLASSIYE